MINGDKDVEFIERYLDGNLSPDEKKDFELRLSVDERFKAVFNTYNNLIEGIKYSGKKELLQKLKRVEASIALEENFENRILGIKVVSFYRYSAAATILLLLSFTLVFFLNHQSTSKEVYAEYFQAYPNVVLPTTRGDQQIKSLKEEAFRLYDLEEYKEAASKFEEVLKNEKDDDVLLYVANSYMSLGNYDSAISKLNDLKVTDSHFAVQAQWYLALSYLAKNEVKKSRDILENLKAQKNSYSKKAENILKELE